MIKNGFRKSIGAVSVSFLLFAGWINAAEFDVTKDNHAYPTGMHLESKEEVMEFSTADNGGNFTGFENVKDLKKDGETIKFSLTGKTAVVRWGNVLGNQLLKDIKSLFPEKFILKLRVKQSAGKSKWVASPYRDGKLMKLKKYKPFTAFSQGSQWNKLTFKSGRFENIPISGGPVEGIEFKITGKKDTVIEISSLQASQKRFEGYLRHEFDLPEGKIWSAVADVLAKNRSFWYGTSEISSELYINGRKVERQGALQIYHTAPVDLTPYLKPGQKNVAAYYGYRLNYPPPLAMRAEVVMESGKTTVVESGTHWKYSHKLEDGWNKVGFNDSKWKNVPKGAGVWSSVRDFGLKMCLPTYKGPIKLRNPGGKFLYFFGGKSLAFDVTVPAGFADQNPYLSWKIGKADSKGNVEAIAEGDVRKYLKNKNSLLFKPDIEKLENGVYVIALALRDAGGKVVALRSREPFVILDKIKQAAVTGVSYTEGMDIELEDEIDFTDLKEAHPYHEWVVTKKHKASKSPDKPTIISKGGLTYRQVNGSAYGSGFSYRFEFKHPGSFYMLELAYPDNEERMIQVSITSKKDGVRFSSQSSAGVETGGKFYNTGKMKKLRWVQVADSGPHSVDVVNGTLQTSAAAAGIKIYRIKGNLPAVKTGTLRSYGIHTERQFFNNGFGRNFGIDRPMTQSEKAAEKNAPVMNTFLKDLFWLKSAGEKYIQYLKFAGQNSQIIGCFQYTNYNTVYASITETGDSRVPWCTRSMLAHLFEINGLEFYAGMEYSQSLDMRSQVNDAQIANGADTINMVDSQGHQRYVTEIFTIVPNWLHPAVQQNFVGEIDKMVDTFDHLKAFKGIHNFIGPSQWGSGYWMPGVGYGEKWDQPLLVSYDDITMGRFSKETGTSLPAEKTDPERFKKRAQFIKNTQKVRELFLKWHCDNFTELMKKTADTVKRGSKNYQFINVLPLENKETFEFLANSKRTLKDIMKDFAFDMDGMKKIDNFWLGRWTLSWRQVFRRPAPHQNPYLWKAKEDPEFIKAFDSEDKRYVLCRTSWDENHIITGDLTAEESKGWGKLIRGTDWIQNKGEITMMPQPSGRSAREALCQAIITADPTLLLSGFTDVNINLGHEQDIRSITAPYTFLPKEKFKNILNTDLTSNLAIRVLNRKEDSWFYLVNPGFWPFRGTVTVKSGADIYSVPDGKKAAGKGDSELKIELEPFSIKIFKSAAADLVISKYETAVLAGEEIDRLQQMAERTGLLCDDPNAMTAISEKERKKIKMISADILKLIKKRQYALAWSKMKSITYWNSRIFLEKAMENQTMLPGSFAKEAVKPGTDTLPHLTAKAVKAPLMIDGKLDEDIWTSQPFQAGFVASDGKPSLIETGLKAAYSDDTLYLAVACADKDMSSLRATASGEDNIWTSADDAIALFIQPDPAKPVYYQMAFNPAGILFDQKVDRDERDYKFAPDWQVKCSKGENYWIAEAAIPFKAFAVAEPEKIWRLNVFRRFRKDKIKYSGWSHTPGSWHSKERFGKLELK
ncbi:MAG: sugar-binding protein [Planctomycetota bacterium]|jgi:hypothetical protein